MKNMLSVGNTALMKRRSVIKAERYFCVKYLFGFIIYKKIIFHFSVEEMREKEQRTKPEESNNNLPDDFNNQLHSFGMIFPEPNAKPMFESVREGTTATIILMKTHELQPLCFS